MGSNPIVPIMNYDIERQHLEAGDQIVCLKPDANQRVQLLTVESQQGDRVSFANGTWLSVAELCSGRYALVLKINKHTIKAKYDPSYGGERLCYCGHSYERHFDGYEGDAHVGCKYCRCNVFGDRDDESAKAAWEAQWGNTPEEVRENLEYHSQFFD